MFPKHNFKETLTKNPTLINIYEIINSKQDKNQELVPKQPKPRDIRRKNNRGYDELKVTRGYDLKKHRFNHKLSKAPDTINTYIKKRFAGRNTKR